VPIIYHIATASDWYLAVKEGEYTTSTLGRSLAEVGFLHASSASQVTWVANSFYQGVADELLLLVIDTTRLASPLRYEAVPGWDEPFPHVYGPLNPDAVLQAVPLRPGPDGTYAPSPVS
jgi:uncharacterized protein (DUF952 family)